MKSRDFFLYCMICLTFFIMIYSHMYHYSVSLGWRQTNFIQDYFARGNVLTRMSTLLSKRQTNNRRPYSMPLNKINKNVLYSSIPRNKKTKPKTNSVTTAKTYHSSLATHRNQNKHSRQTKMKQKLTGCASWPNMYENKSGIKVVNKSEFSNWKLFEQNRSIKDVDCRLLFANNVIEQKQAAEKIKHFNYTNLSYFNVNKTKNCENYIKSSGFITSSLTSEEEDFPIAYSMLVFKDIRQVEMLLRAIYRPQNVYCIHCDIKASANFKTALKGIVQCFQNVFISSDSFDVSWGTINVLLPELTCMKELLKYKKWKYFINLTGQEFPLRTNYELVKILKMYNGSNNLESTVKRVNKDRFEGRPKPPHNIRPVKGSVHIVANRGYVDFVVNNKIAADFLNWTKQVDVPDETYFASLNSNSHLKIPGSYIGDPETDCDTYPFLTRFKNWGNSVYNWQCYGKRIRLICIFGIGDLPLLARRQELFTNKFHWDYQPYAYQCMDELIFNRTRDEYFKLLDFNFSKYQSLPFLRNTV